MARRSRKISALPEAKPPAVKGKRYRCAAYVRLSAEDGGKVGTDTIEDQKRLVLHYIEKEPSLEFAELYCDNGQSGATFERPAFKRLIEAVKAGRIDCIVVKDLSRFGRNYKESGNYIERIFPFFGVRFIAVNDHFDTLMKQSDSTGLIMPLKNLVNELYCKDISRKIATALEAKQRRGEFVGGWAPYGYRRCGADLHRLEIDEQTAPVVQKIFQWAREGASYREIERRLNQSGVACPAKELYRRGMIKQARFSRAMWNTTSIRRILSNPVYLGHMVQGRHRQSLFEGKKRYAVAPQQWKTVENTHPAIVLLEVFEEVQKLKKRKKEAYCRSVGKYAQPQSENIFFGKVYCAACQNVMRRHRQYYGKQEKTSLEEFFCATHARFGTCTSNYLAERRLKAMVSLMLKQQRQLIDPHSQRTQTAGRLLAAPKRLPKPPCRKAALEANVKRVRRLRENLYQAYLDGMISRQVFQMRKRQYAGAVKAVEDAICRQEDTALPQDAVSEKAGQSGAASIWLRDMVEVMVDRIYVAEGGRVEIVLTYRDIYEEAAGGAVI